MHPSMFFIIIFILVLLYLIFDLIRDSILIPRLNVNPNGKAVLITGCDSGFGNRLAQRLNQLGFKVYATVLNTQSSGAKELKTNAFSVKKMIVLKMDVTNDTEVNDVYKKVMKELNSDGHVFWAVVNNAGKLTTGLLDWGTLNAFRQLFEINVFGTVLVTRVFLPLIKASKDTLRRELYDSGVNVCSIEPGYFKTQLSSMENCIAQMENSWNESTDEVKKSHSSPETHVKKNLTYQSLVQSEENIDIVVDDMIDAIINCRPKAIYSPMGPLIRVTKFVFHYLPTEFMDWVFYRIDKMICEK